MENNLITLFNGWAEQGVILQLLNKDMTPVAALYLDKLKFEQLTISTTNTSEKYYIYLGGIAIFFTYYRKTN